MGNVLVAPWKIDHAVVDLGGVGQSKERVRQGIGVAVLLLLPFVPFCFSAAASAVAPAPPPWSIHDIDSAATACLVQFVLNDQDVLLGEGGG